MYTISDGDIESQMHLRDEMIYDLKQRVTLLTEERDNAIYILTSENEWLRSLLDESPLKEESTNCAIGCITMCVSSL